MTNPNPILGTAIVLLGGVAAALYLLPFRGVKGWAYETGWLVSVIAGWLVFPLVFDFFVVPHFADVLGVATAGTLARTVGFGVLWGVGALSWALMVRYLGIGLGLGIGAGLCAATGTILPPVCTGHAADLVATASARIVLVGVGVALAGIVCVGLAGRMKEGEMSAEAKKKAVAEFDFRKGLVAALVAGVASAGINFGLQGAPELERAALAAGASPVWAGMPVLTVVLWGGVLTQVAWVMVKRWSGGEVERWRGGEVKRWSGEEVEGWRGGEVERHHSTPPPLHHSTILLNFLLSCSVGVVGVMQFVCQKAGEPRLGEIRYISFAVLMSSAVFFSALVGILLGEWRGTGPKTRAILALGLLFLLVGFNIMALGR